jgi:hypothetical protein
MEKNSHPSSNSNQLDEENIMKLTFDSPDIEKIISECRVDSIVQKDKKIGECITKNGLKFPIYAPFYGKITKIDSEEKFFVLERCKHEAFYINLCAQCYYDRRSDQKETKMMTSKYASLHPIITFSEKVR